MIRTTPDAYVGLENPTPEEWSAWHRAMRSERRAEPTIYDDARTAWSDTTFRQLFLFMYDASFWKDGYRTEALVEEWKARFGRVDEVLLWHAYPRLGFDARTQFDFYRDMPAGLRTNVCDVLHAHGIRVFVDYNPWDAGTHDELAAIVHALDADGVMLDTMTDVPTELARAVERRKTGVVFAPELRPKIEDLAHARQSWAQWYDVGDASTPSIYRHRWLVPRHRQFAIARWDTSRRKDIVYSFFNGSGLVLWENVFGSYNPYSRADRRLIAETAAVFDHYEDLFARGEWLPLVPTGVRGLDANRFVSEGRELFTFRNRTDAPLSFTVPEARAAGLSWAAFWGDCREPTSGRAIIIEPHGTQALVHDDPARARAALAHFDALSRRADVDDPPKRPPMLVSAPRVTPGPSAMIDLAGGAFAMHIRHERRECGCYSLGAASDLTWGWHYKDVIAHDVHVVLEPFAIRRTAVTNAEFVAFVHASGYRPKDPTRFLAHVARASDGALTLTNEQAALPVTYVSLADARAFAAFEGHRLPTEAEWQHAAGPNRFPWGDEDRSFPNALRAAADEDTATREGVLGLCGNAWELTESEHTDGHTHFVMLRGGVFLPPGTSEWLPARGPQSNESHVKYILVADGLDRSETISFRTVKPHPPG